MHRVRHFLLLTGLGTGTSVHLFPHQVFKCFFVFVFVRYLKFWVQFFCRWPVWFEKILIERWYSLSFNIFNFSLIKIIWFFFSVPKNNNGIFFSDWCYALFTHLTCFEFSRIAFELSTEKVLTILWNAMCFDSTGKC